MSKTSIVGSSIKRFVTVMDRRNLMLLGDLFRSGALPGRDGDGVQARLLVRNKVTIPDDEPSTKQPRFAIGIEALKMSFGSCEVQS